MANILNDDEVSYLVQRLLNSGSVADGSTIPRSLKGSYRVPFASAFKVVSTTASFGGTIFVFSWDSAKDKFVSHYNIYTRNVLKTNDEPTLIGTSAKSPCTAKVTSDLAGSVVFFLQTVLLNGQSSVVIQGPTCTATVVSPTLSSGSIQDRSIGLIKLGLQAQGSLITFDNTQAAVLVAPGVSGQILTSAGPASQPSFQAPAAPANGSITLPMLATQTAGNLITYSAASAPVLVAAGTTGQVLTSAGAGAVPAFATPTSTFATDLILNTVGKGIQVKEGANATMGAATLVAGTVVVSTTKVTANSRIFLTPQNNSGTVGFVSVSARTAATSFTILSSSATDTSLVGWWISEPS